MLSRRSFLAASAAAPLVLSHTARAAANERLTLGFIGVGTMGRGHLGGYLGRKDVEVVAVCDVVKERLDSAAGMVEKKYADRKKAGTWKGVKSFPDFRELLADKSIDAVVIATPDHWHANAAVLSARAGKHIYCEKPLTHNIAEGRWLVEEIKKAKITFQVGSQQRSEFANRFRAAVEMIWNGWIGDVKTVRIGVAGPNRPCDLPTQEIPVGTDWDFWQGPAPERGYNEILCPKGVHSGFPKWRDYREYAGGYVADMGAHHFDIAQWALKMDGSGPVEVNPPTDPKQLSGLTFTYANGVKMIHGEFVKNKEGRELKADCVFEGTEGTILVGRGQLEVIFNSGSKAQYPDAAKRVTPSSDHKQNWLEAIKAGKEPICPPEIGHRTATVCHLGNLGYQLRRKLKWDPVKEEFANDDEANKLRSREPRAKWKVT
ncbi:Gfo/Idh/MocA family protein [Limnoglobus roseus]|uniref:Putative Rossmann-fold-type glycoside hydrolase n=1 Tax=Limnoglobus roseus TaxID=2598579 RepID=A0A5C1ACL9_9BACT|nr:Gfo/Idh/MocA family oxidoreductase [Limnoglobus roseus]QEL15943.1 putative Rossmann-fold-type glycoside hydrolase [Limnoglobus roseus]